MPTRRRIAHCLAAIAGVAFVASASLVSPPAGAETRARQLERLAEFERFAGAPVDEIRRFRIDRWQSLGPKHLAVWASVNDAYLIEVLTPCTGLEFTDAIGLTLTVSFVTRFDRVQFKSAGGIEQHCPIKSIRPVDYKALREARKARKAAGQGGP